jgi:hypothetical protein
MSPNGRENDRLSPRVRLRLGASSGPMHLRVGMNCDVSKQQNK